MTNPFKKLPLQWLVCVNERNPVFDEFLLLRFVATNVEPYPFAWIDEREIVTEYSVMLTRISREYDHRFA